MTNPGHVSFILAAILVLAPKIAPLHKLFEAMIRQDFLLDTPAMQAMECIVDIFIIASLIETVYSLSSGGDSSENISNKEYSDFSEDEEGEDEEGGDFGEDEDGGEDGGEDEDDSNSEGDDLKQFGDYWTTFTL